MIKALRRRPRPDNLVNQVRAGGKNTARRLYLASIWAAAGFIVYQLVGPMIFLDADGMARRETQIVAADFVGRVESVMVKPGDTVRAGEAIALLSSHDTTSQLGELAARLSALEARRSQLEGRLRTLERLKPSAEDRLSRSTAAMERVAELAKRQLTTAARVAEAGREAFEAEKEVSNIMGEWRAVRDELEGVLHNQRQMARLESDLKTAYAGGRITARVSGTVGARVAAPGTVVSRGQPIAEIHHGDAFVTAFVPHGRLYGLSRGERVAVSDGVVRRTGRIMRLERVSDQLPQEFQSTLRSVERQQLMHIVLDDRDAPFATPSKVRVTGLYTPGAISTLARSILTVAENRFEPLQVDTSAVASVGAAAPPAPATGQAEAYPFGAPP
jgi:multidrug resistance efflux pump